MENFYQLLDEVGQYVNQFYENAIKLHNNPQLRSLAGLSIPIIGEHGGRQLGYGEKGFYAVVPRCIERGSAWENGVYEYPLYNFHEKDGKLVVKSYNGLEEMLHLFPTLTLGVLEEKLTQGMRKSGLFRSAGR